VNGFSCRAIDSEKRFEFVNVCFPDFFYAFEVLQQNRFSFFTDSRDCVQLRLQRSLYSTFAVKSYGKAMGFVSDSLQEQ
jgi:hypothetical protein